MVVFVGLLEGPWYDYGCPWDPLVSLWEALVTNLTAFGLPLSVFWRASVGKSEIVKSEGWRVIGGSYVGLFFPKLRVGFPLCSSLLPGPAGPTTLPAGAGGWSFCD